MADATQVQRRRGTAAQCDAMVPAEAEVIVDLTNDTLRVGDGIRYGGFIIPNFNQVQTQQFVYAVAGGTGNAITVDLSPALIGYVGGTSIEFRASNNNTGAATINVNGLGAKNIQKLSGGVLTALASGDLVAGIVYRVTYDGTQFQVTNAEFSPPAPTGGLVKISTTSLVGFNYLSPINITIPSGYTSCRLDLTNMMSTTAQTTINIKIGFASISDNFVVPALYAVSSFVEMSISSSSFVSFFVNGATSKIASNTSAVTVSNIQLENVGSYTFAQGTATLYGRQ